MPVEVIEYYHTWCDECLWTDDVWGSYDNALAVLDNHVAAEH